MRLKNLKLKFLKGEISKVDYINSMHKIHQYLSEYAAFIKDTDIARIEITDGLIVMVSRKSKVKMIVNTNDKRTTPIEIVNFGAFEKNDFPMLLKLIYDNSVFFDIGANIGWVSINVAKMKKNVKVFAFEPIPETFTSLKENIKINQIKTIKAFNFGFSNQENESFFYYDLRDSGSASLANLSSSAHVKRVKCSLKKLDDFITEAKVKIDCIKCDVEGAEFFVFEGGIKTLEKQKPIIFVEMLRKWAAKFNYNPNDTIELLKNIGYTCYFVKNDRLVELRRMMEKTAQTNFFFLHKVKHKDKILSLFGLL